MLGVLTAIMLLLPEVVMPRPTEIAAAQGDSVELERLSTRLGPSRLVELCEEAAGQKKPRLVNALLRGIALSGGAHSDLGAQIIGPFSEALTRLARAAQLDEKQLQLASDALRKSAFALGLSPCGAAAAESEMEGDCDPARREVADRLLTLGADATLPMTLREGALESLAELPPKSFAHLMPQLEKLAQSSSRPGRSALGVLGSLVPREHPQPLLSLVKSAPLPLASDAAQELCAVMAPRRTAHAAPLFSDEIAVRLRALAAPEQPIAQRQELLDCLRLLGTPADRALAQSILAARKKGNH